MTAGHKRKIERPKSVTNLVLERLRDDIIQNRFELGARVSEAQLSELYGVTKAPIRSAYIRLASEGLLEVRPQSGTYIFLPDAEGIAAMCELRTALELEALSLAMARQFRALSDFFVDVVARMDAALAGAEGPAYHELDSELHTGLMRLAHSPLLAATYAAQVNGRFSALRTRFSTSPGHNAHSIAEHHRLRDLICAGDESEARLLMRAHVEATKDYYQGFLNS